MAVGIKKRFMKQFHIVNMVFLVALAACSPKVSNGGYAQESEIKDQIVVGQTTKDQVREKLGSPSSQSEFGNETWYYIANRQETVAFLAPQIVKQEVVSVEFDNAGVVSKINNYNKTDGQQFALEKQTTPTEGHTLGFFEQLLGNIGRFNHPVDGSDTVAPGRKPGG
jgi:outer membrane protein assembly factor BamE (lipoprotein component of BamABCDE complex)